MQSAIDVDKLERTVFESIQKKVLGLLSVSGNTEYMHSIANLALLNTADNAALNNSAFDVKRNDIIQMDKKGQYIPFCTKMVFLKYYTPSAENQLHFWGQADRIAYPAGTGPRKVRSHFRRRSAPRRVPNESHHNSIIVFEDTRGHVQTKCKACGRKTVFNVLEMRRLRRLQLYYSSLNG